MWGILWRSSGNEHLMFRGPAQPALFPTRAAARAYIAKTYGYIARRPDLRAHPHGWRMPVPVRVKLVRE